MTNNWNEKIELKLLSDLEEIFGEHYSKLTKKQLKIRNIIMSVHLFADELMQNAIIESLKPDLYRTNESQWINLREFLDKTSFPSKIKLCLDLGFIEKESFLKLLHILNNIRNGFAHGYSKNDKRFIYKNKNIFDNSRYENFIKDIQAMFGILIEKLKKAGSKTVTFDSLKP